LEISITWRTQKVSAKESATDYGEALAAIQRAVKKLESLCCKAAVSHDPHDLVHVQWLVQGIREECTEIERWSVYALPAVGVEEFDWMHPPGMRH
jgi:hypothetical protein